MMNTRVLSEAEIQYALTLPNPNDRKSYVQSLILDHLARVKHLLVTAHTRFGKLHMCKELLNRYRKISSKPVNVVVPTGLIRDDFIAALNHHSGIRYYLNPTYGGENLDPQEYQCGIFIGDEFQFGASAGTKRNSTILAKTTSDFSLLLSATLEKEHKEFLESQGIHHEFSVPLKTGVRLGIVPTYQNLNIPVQLTDPEKDLYVQLEDKINGYIRLFDAYKPDKGSQTAWSCCPAPDNPSYKDNAAKVARALGFMTSDGVIGSAINYRTTVGKRANLLYEASAKQELALKFLDMLPRQKIILFCSRLATGDRMAKRNPGIQVFRGGVSKKDQEISREMMRAFYAEEKPYLCGCNILNQGLTVNDCSTAIDLGTKSKKITSVQKIGRVLGLDPNDPYKLSSKLNLYVDDFDYQLINGQVLHVESQEKRWLINSQRGQLFIEWITDLEDLSNYIQLNTVPMENAA